MPQNPEEAEARRKALARAKKRRKISSVKTAKHVEIKETEAQKLLSWRTDRFQKECGMSRAQARKWADSDADWHKLQDYLKGNKNRKPIPLKLAMKILNPF